jgi:hypothetical protein
MESPQGRTSSFLRDRMAECLKAQARLCERIASECWSEKIAGKFKRLAQECNEAAVMKESQSGTVGAVTLGAKCRVC